MYSLMSTRISACGSANRNFASARASSVFPTPVGPEKMNEPIGRFGSLSPARLRRIERDERLDRLVLRDDRSVQLLFHSQQTRGLGFLQTHHGNSRPAADDERDFLFAEHRAVRLAMLLPLFLLACESRPAARAPCRAAMPRARSSGREPPLPSRCSLPRAGP